LLLVAAYPDRHFPDAAPDGPAADRRIQHVDVLLAKAALILRTTETELVDMSKNAVSGFMPSMSPFGPSATASTSAGTRQRGEHDFRLLADRLRAVGPDGPFAR